MVEGVGWEETEELVLAMHASTSHIPEKASHVAGICKWRLRVERDLETGDSGLATFSRQRPKDPRPIVAGRERSRMT